MLFALEMTCEGNPKVSKSNALDTFVGEALEKASVSGGNNCTNQTEDEELSWRYGKIYIEIYRCTVFKQGYHC